jgi:hypothetical protein
MPTPAETAAAALAAAEPDNVEVQRLIREAIAARSVLVFAPVAAPPPPGSASYLEVLARMRNGVNYDALTQVVAIEGLIRDNSYTEAKWNQLVGHLIGLASAARTAYADAIIAALGEE